MEERKRFGRTKINESRGKETRTSSYSKRYLDVIERKCPYCNHHKAISTSTQIKCSRCKKIIK